MLSKRLSAAAQLVSPGSRVVDVGCDHGFLPIELVKSRKCPAAIAMDLRDGPLKRAQEHVRSAGLEDKIELRLSDGLTALKAGEGDALVIMGMGGPLMERILSAYPLVRDSFRELILSPQSDLPHFRAYLEQNDYRIIAERMLEEDHKYYVLIKAVKIRQNKDRPLSDLQKNFGPLLLKEKDPVLYEFLTHELGVCDTVLEQLKKTDREKAASRRAEVERKKQLILAAFSLYE